MRPGRLLALSAAAGLGWLLLAPTRVKAKRWEGLPPAPARNRGPYADNARLSQVTRFAQPPGLHAPECAAVDREGRVYTGFEGGRIVRFSPDGQTFEDFADTGGRPLGLRFHPDGDLLVADVIRGLLRISPTGQLTVLATEAAGVRINFADDLDVDRAGRYVYFSDASTKYGWHEDIYDLLEHGGHGRVLRHDLQTGETLVIGDDFNFANGVTLCPDEAYLLVCETGAARIWRYWLKGPHAEGWEVFIDNLPAYPDNVRYDGQGLFWVALPSRRTALLDATPQSPVVREMVARLLPHIKLPLKEEAMLLALDREGQPVAYAMDAAPGCYSYITNVLPHGDDLLLTSLHQKAPARIRRAQVLG